MDHENDNGGIEEYPVRFYEEFLDHIRRKYDGQYWHPLPKEMARFWKENMVPPEQSLHQPKAPQTKGEASKSR